MSSAIVQKAHGVIADLGAGGAISFPNPTVAGNCVLVTFAFVSTNAITGSASIADPANGNCFFPGSDPTAISYNTDMSGAGTFTIYTTLQSKSVLGGTTLHVDSLQTMTFSGFTGQTQPAYVWMYEISYIGAPALVAGPPFAAWWNALNSPAGSGAVNASSTPVSPDTAQVPGDVADGGGAIGPMLCLCTIIADGAPNWTGVADGTGGGAVWTMDVVQNGIAVAYAEPAGIGDQQAQFTNGDGSHNYAALFYVVADTQAIATTGNIVIQKATVPGGLPQSFTFTPSYGAPFQLSDGQSNDSGPLAPGTYSVAETPLSTFNTSVSSDPAAIVVTAGQTTTVTFTNTKLSTCAPLAQSGNPVDGVFIQDLSLFIIPSSALYTSLVPFADIRVNESSLQGRNSVILDFNDSEGLYVRDLGTIFTWPMTAHTELYVWQPSIIPLDDDLYPRLSFHFLMKGLETVGWGHIRELNIPFSSTTDLTLLLTFDTGAVPSSISITIPNSGGQESKVKITMPPNKFKLVEGFLSSAQPFLLWENDMECKIKSWGSAEPYRIVKPFFG